MPAAARSRSQGDGATRCGAGPAAKSAARSRIGRQADKADGARAGNGLDATPTYALLPQLETGKMNCVRPPRYGRLPPGTRRRKRGRHAAVPRQIRFGSMPAARKFPTVEAHLRKALPIFAGRHPRVTLEQISEETDVLISDL